MNRWRTELDRLLSINDEEANDAGTDEPLPEMLGRYRVQSLLGKGGFGVVLRAYDDQLDRDVAIKIPHPDLVRTPEQNESFLSEARVLAALNHASIVPVYDVGKADGLCFVVSRYFSGGDLRDYIESNRSNPNTIESTIDILLSIADGLSFVHRHGVIHRDIKPENIFLGEDGHAFVGDFGLATHKKDPETLNRVGGTPAYMSPEQIRGQWNDVGPASDVFSLGCVFYELLCGAPPFRAKSRTELASKILHDEPEPPSRGHSLSTELNRICFRALAKRPNDRYSTAAQFADELRVVVRPKFWSRRRVVASSMLFAIVLLGLGFVWCRVRSGQLVERLLESEIATAPALVEQLDAYRWWAEPRLKEAMESPHPPIASRAALVLLDSEPQAFGVVFNAALHAEFPTYAVLAHVMERSPHRLLANVSSLVESDTIDDRSLLVAACLTARVAPERTAEIFGTHSTALANELVRLNLDGQATGIQWLPEARRLRDWIAVPLAMICADTGREESECDMAGKALMGLSDAEFLCTIASECSPTEVRGIANAINSWPLEPDGLEPFEALLRDAEINAGYHSRWNTAVLLYRLGDREPILTRMTERIDGRIAASISEYGLSLADLSPLYENASNHQRQWLLIWITSLPDDAMNEYERMQFCDRLLANYKTQISGPLVSLSGSILRQCGRGDELGLLEDELAIEHQTLPSKDARQWFFTVNRHLMMKTTSQKESLFVAQAETSREQFAEFLRDSAIDTRDVDEHESQLPAHPITPRRAAEYCNWLSDREGIAQEQWCYIDLESALAPKADTTRSGYRLPTSDEIEGFGLSGGVENEMQVDTGLRSGQHRELFDGGTISEGSFRVVRAVRKETP